VASLRRFGDKLALPPGKSLWLVTDDPYCCCEGSTGSGGSRGSTGSGGSRGSTGSGGSRGSTGSGGSRGSTGSGGSVGFQDEACADFGEFCIGCEDASEWSGPYATPEAAYTASTCFGGHCKDGVDCGNLCTIVREIADNPGWYEWCCCGD